jgi:hypothetical protein
MKPVEFERVVVSRRQEGELVIALFDGSCVAMLTCDDDAARALIRALTSALKSSKT